MGKQTDINDYDEFLKRKLTQMVDFVCSQTNLEGSSPEADGER
jgi:hypothetical protein